MPRSIEAEGANVEEAIGNALAALRVQRSQVEIAVLDGTANGVARVRATVRSDDGVSPETSADAGGRARKLLEDLLGYLVDDARVEVVSSVDGDIGLAVETADGGAVIGRRGETLDALEHVLNRVVFRDHGAPAGRIAVDVEGYRERRRESLGDLARRLADKARETGEIVTMNPLSPRDRRIVHLTLRDDAAVTTRSEGDGHFKRVQIVPASRSRQT